MRGVPTRGVSAERRAKEERLVLLRLDCSHATIEQLTDDLGVRIGPRIRNVVELLTRTTGERSQLVTGDGKPRAVYWLTDAGKAFAEQLKAERRAA